MPRALNLLREEPQFRRACFTEGLQAAGFAVVGDVPSPRPGDVVLTWNRTSSRDAEARRFATAGATVLVAENNYLGIRGWYALARDHHAGLGRWPQGDGARWAALGVELEPWRADGAEVVILGQRSIGEKGIASPHGWEESVRRKICGRVRKHPGKARHAAIPLDQDLRAARCVVTWASAAALRALAMGIPVFYGLPGWIGAAAARPIAEFDQVPKRDDAARLAMFERLAWAMAPIDEIRSGEAICRLIEHSRSGTTRRA